jgi:hypothetical protein
MILRAIIRQPFRRRNGISMPEHLFKNPRMIINVTPADSLQQHVYIPEIPDIEFDHDESEAPKKKEHRGKFVDIRV